MMSFLYSLDPSCVEGLRTFDITCSLSGNLLRCISDSTVMPGSSVTVTTMNCDGQTAEYEVRHVLFRCA